MTNHRQTPLARIPGLTVAVAIAAALGLAACGRSEDGRTAGQKVDETMARAEQKADAAGTAVRKAVDDAAITASVNAQLARDPDLSALRIDVDTVDGRVALKGSAPNAAARDRATLLVSAIDGVRGVDNQLVVPTAGG